MSHNIRDQCSPKTNKVCKVRIEFAETQLPAASGHELSWLVDAHQLSPPSGLPDRLCQPRFRLRLQAPHHWLLGVEARALMLLRARREAQALLTTFPRAKRRLRSSASWLSTQVKLAKQLEACVCMYMGAKFVTPPHEPIAIQDGL